MTVRIARWSATHPWRAIALRVLFVAASIAIGAVAGTNQPNTSGDVGETARAEQMIDAGNFPDQPAEERVLITSPSGPLDRAAADATALDAVARMRALPGVAAVEDPAASPDGSALAVAVKLAGDPRTAPDQIHSRDTPRHGHPVRQRDRWGRPFAGPAAGTCYRPPWAGSPASFCSLGFSVSCRPSPPLLW